MAGSKSELSFILHNPITIRPAGCMWFIPDLQAALSAAGMIIGVLQN